MLSQPSFADTSSSGQRDEPVAGEDLPNIFEFIGSSYEAGELHGKVMSHNGYHRSQRRILVVQIRVAQLHHAFGPGQVGQVMHAEVDQPCAGWKMFDSQIGGGARQ